VPGEPVLSEFYGDVEIGEIICGKKFAPAVAPEITIGYKSKIASNYLTSHGGQKYGYNSFGRRKQWSLNWSYITKTEKESFEQLFLVTHGNKYPFYIDLGEYDTPKLYLVRFIDPELNITQITGDAYSVAVTIESEV
jgi:hypothetical protein